MNERVIIFLIGSMLILITCQDSPDISSLSSACRVYMNNLILTANCSRSRIKLGAIPENLGTNIEALDLSHNAVGPINSKIFISFPLLLRLKMTDLVPFDDEESGTAILTLHKDAFTPLVKLEHLDMTNSFHGYHFENFCWPPLLQELVIAQMSLTEINLENLTNLVRVDAEQNALKSLPKFHSYLPTLTYLRMRENPIQTLKVEVIASLCNLERLEIDNFFNTSNAFYISTEPFYCECLHLQKWIQDFGIDAFNVPCSKHDATELSKCDLNFDEDILSIYEACLNQLYGVLSTSTSTPTSNVAWMLFQIFLAILLMACIIYVSYNLYLSVKTGADSRDENESKENEEWLDEEETI